MNTAQKLMNVESTKREYDNQAIALAVAVLVPKYLTLPEESKDRLQHLVILLSKAKSEEEHAEIKDVMLEILSAAPLPSKELDERLETSTEPLKKWKSHIGGRIKTMRESAELTQAELAEKAGLPQSHISRLENGAHSPTRLTLEKIASALGIALRDLDVTQE